MEKKNDNLIDVEEIAKSFEYIKKTMENALKGFVYQKASNLLWGTRSMPLPKGLLFYNDYKYGTLHESIICTEYYCPVMRDIEYECGSFADLIGDKNG